LPALWPEPAVWTDVGGSLVFTQNGVPATEISGRLKRVTVVRCDRQRPRRQIRDGKGSRTPQSKSAVLRMRCTEVQQDPGSVHPCPARSVTFLSVIYTILTHNPFSGESGVIETFAPAIDYPQFVGVGSRAVNDFVW